MTNESICFRCIHFRQDQPLTFLHPGECTWMPVPAPEWARLWLESTERYYGPNREVWSRGHVVTDCDAFSEKTP